MDSVDEVPPCWSELALAPGSWIEAGVEAAVGADVLLHCGFIHTLTGRQDRAGLAAAPIYRY